MRIADRTTLLIALILGMVFTTIGFSFVARGDANGMRLETRLLGQNQWFAGSQAQLRVIALDHMSQTPVSGANVTITAAAKGSKTEVRLASGRTDVHGTLDSTFAVPKTEGDYNVKVVVRGLGETDLLESAVKVKRAYRVMLTTDKPLYQPGQVIHIRALALSIPQLLPVTGRKLTLEVDDSKGNKVFKKTSDLSKFGLASTDFQLATEINQGEYKIRAIVDKERAEKTVRVERYVLPKFKITMETDKKYYLPGETVKGTVHADYFFGKPVEGKVVIKMAGFDAGFNDFAEVTGRTNGVGVFKFEQKLPAFFAGQPLEQGNAFFKAEVAVTDGADHAEKITKMVPVSKDPLKITIIPEGGRLIPKLRNTVYVVVSYPDGTPARATVTFGKGQTAKTNEYGIAEFGLVPEGGVTLTASARDEQGRTAQTSEWASLEAGNESILLRLDKAVASVGDDLNLTVLCSKPDGYVYIDVVKDGQTMHTASLGFHKGRGEMAVPLSADMFGTLQVHAYRISRTGNIIRDSRTVYVNPASDLKIAVSADRKTYLPGQAARINFDVTDRKGRGLAAALGISIVDESVFALQEMQPGLEKIYFMLEKELAEPKFEIHGITPDDIVERPETRRAFSPEKQKAAKVLFAAVRKERANAAPAQAFTLQADSYAQKIEKAREKLAAPVVGDWNRIAEAIRKFYSAGPKANLSQLGGIHYLVQEGLLPKSILADRWGMAYEFPANRWSDYQYQFTAVSHGPDRRQGTVDDIAVYGSPTGRQKPQLAMGMESRDQSRFGGVAGGGFGGRGDFFFRDGVVFKAQAAMPAGIEAITAFDMDNKLGVKDKKEAGAPDVRVRQYFPETLYFNPGLITDNNGKGSISLDMADSITTWRLSAMASSLGGLLGSTTSPLRVFQDFFIDIDLPVALTQNDEVSIPIAVYNYLPQSQKVKLQITTEPWFELDGSATQTLDIASGDVRAIYYRIKVKQIGWHKLMVHAFGSKMNDAISRDIEVLPDGQLVEDSINDRLEKNVTKTVSIPKGAIDGASNILVKVYPGFFSQLVEGMDKILQMPFGCFEQTSSTTYPNILALDYMRSTNQSTPAVQMKAEQYINLGYQRLLTFEVPGGGFSWFGDAPANKILTAWGLMEFADMAKVYEVDPSLITRTQKWLASKQEADGSWKPDANYLHEESWGRIQHNEILPTAYITWGLRASGYTGKEADKGIEYLLRNWEKVDDAYTLAIIANALYPAPRGNDAKAWPQGEAVLRKLVDIAKDEDGKVHWESKVSTITFTGGKGADLEATGLATYALIKSGLHTDTVNRALTFIVSAKDPNGTWYSTQATILCLKALIASIENRTQDIDANVTVLINGQKAGEFKINRENSDVMRQVDGKEFVREGENTVELRFEGKGSSLYQISSKYYVSWEARPAGLKKIMDISVAYDRTSLEKDEILTASVKVAFNGKGSANMVMVDLGVPPGFDVLTEDLQKLVESKLIQKFSLTGRQIIIYLDKVEADKPVAFNYRLKAKYPLRAKTPRSVVYQYYNPEIRDVAAPVELTVK